MLNGFHHIAIQCKDIDKSIAFYTALGGTVYRTWGEGNSRACMIGFGKENYLELFANGSPKNSPSASPSAKASTAKSSNSSKCSKQLKA